MSSSFGMVWSVTEIERSCRQEMSEIILPIGLPNWGCFKDPVSRFCGPAIGKSLSFGLFCGRWHIVSLWEHAFTYLFSSPFALGVGFVMSTLGSICDLRPGQVGIYNTRSLTEWRVMICPIIWVLGLSRQTVRRYWPYRLKYGKTHGGKGWNSSHQDILCSCVIKGGTE